MRTRFAQACLVCLAGVGQGNLAHRMRHVGQPSFVMLLTGDGWGKSSAALGYVLRATARGWPVTMVQFLKGGAWNAAEAQLSVLENVRWPVFTPALTWGAEDPQRLADWAWQEARRAMNSAEGGLVVLDEVAGAIGHGLVEAADVEKAIADRNPRVNVIMTGRAAPSELENAADIVTEFSSSKRRAGFGKPLA